MNLLSCILFMFIAVMGLISCVQNGGVGHSKILENEAKSIAESFMDENDIPYTNRDLRIDVSKDHEHGETMTLYYQPEKGMRAGDYVFVFKLTSSESIELVEYKIFR